MHFRPLSVDSARRIVSPKHESAEPTDECRQIGQPLNILASMPIDTCQIQDVVASLMGEDCEDRIGTAGKIPVHVDKQSTGLIDTVVSCCIRIA